MGETKDKGTGGLEKQIRLPLDELKLAFAASCVEGLARKTGRPYTEVYERMSRTEAIADEFMLEQQR